MRILHLLPVTLRFLSHTDPDIDLFDSAAYGTAAGFDLNALLSGSAFAYGSLDNVIEKRSISPIQDLLRL